MISFAPPYIRVTRASANARAIGYSSMWRIREDCSPRYRPNQVLQIAELPRMLSGKLLEVPVKRILIGIQPEQVAGAPPDGAMTSSLDGQSTDR